MGFIDAPYAYVQQVAAQRHIFQMDLQRHQHIAQQSENALKLFIAVFQAINKSYPDAVADAYNLSPEDAAELLVAMPKREEFAAALAALRKEKTATPLESDFWKTLGQTLENYMELSELLEDLAHPLTEAEEKEADAFWAKQIEEDLASSEITWGGLDDLFD